MGEAFDIGFIYVSRENYFGFGEISTSQPPSEVPVANENELLPHKLSFDGDCTLR